jgi:hypothetical protein
MSEERQHHQRQAMTDEEWAQWQAALGLGRPAGQTVAVHTVPPLDRIAAALERIASALEAAGKRPFGHVSTTSR